MTAPVPAADGGVLPADPTRIDPEAVRAFVGLGATLTADLAPRLRAVEALREEVTAACGPRSPGGDGPERLAAVLRGVTDHDEALTAFLHQLALADQPGPLATVPSHAVPGPVVPGPVVPGPVLPGPVLPGPVLPGPVLPEGSPPEGARSPWLDPRSRSWVVNLTRMAVLGAPPSPELLHRLGRDGPGALAGLARAGWELGPVNQARLLVADPGRLARNWGRAGLSALHAVGGLAGLGAAGAGLVVPGFDQVAERLTGRRPGGELGLQVVEAAHLLLVDPDTLVEAQLGWPELRADPYRWLGRQAPNLVAELGLAEEVLAVLRPIEPGSRAVVVPSRAAAAAETAEIVLAEEAELAAAGVEVVAAEAAIGASSPVRALPDLVEQRLAEPEWGPTAPIVSHRNGPWEPPEEWVSTVNRPGRLAPGRDLNCVDCARAVEANWRGRDAVAAPIAESWSLGGTSRLRLEQWSGGMLVDASLDQIGGLLVELGPGSSAMVVVDWAGGGAHAFNAVNDGGVITWVDGQSGRVGPWPPDYGIRIRSSEAIFMEPDGRPVLPIDD